MNDVHYYLEDLPEIPGVRMLISGLSFESVTGRYLLPLGEGEYSVYTKDGSSRINMRTNGTNHVYSHPNRQILNSEICIDFGHLRVFWGRYSLYSYNRDFRNAPVFSNDHGFVLSRWVNETLTDSEKSSTRFRNSFQEIMEKQHDSCTRILTCKGKDLIDLVHINS